MANIVKTYPRIYNIWRGMKKRCYDSRHDSYRYYGARGISVCKEWLSFKNFLAWALANGYADNLTIDRIDSDGNYEPNNCRWATMREQNRRHRRCMHLTYNGKTQLAIDWAREYGVPLSTFYWRLYKGLSMEEIIKAKEDVNGY